MTRVTVPRPATTRVALAVPITGNLLCAAVTARLSLIMFCALCAMVLILTSAVRSRPIGGGSGQIAFVSNRFGAQLVYLVNVDPIGTAPSVIDVKTLLGVHHVDDPVWSSNGRTLAMALTAGEPAALGIYGIDVEHSDYQRITRRTGDEREPSWSPDNHHIAFSALRDGSYDIYVTNLSTLEERNLTRHQGRSSNPAWSPDGSHIAFTADWGGNQQIYVMNADGSNVQQITYQGSANLGAVWSPDGHQIAFTSNREDTFNLDIFVMSPDGSQVQNVTNSPGRDSDPAWSPDGRLLIFASGRVGARRLYVVDMIHHILIALPAPPLFAEDWNPTWRP